jgi:phosphatidylglycerol lysyltransferase
MDHGDAVAAIAPRTAHAGAQQGVTVEARSFAEAGASPELDRVLDEWLRSRGLPPLHFMVEPRTLHGVVADRELLVARRAGSAVAFLVASPVAARNGYLIEQVARSPDAPNGSSELLIDAAMRRFAEDGRVYVTLGLVALSAQASAASAINPWWLRLMTTFARAHANRFYNFRGLERFRTKMSPAYWETIYAISAALALCDRRRICGDLTVARARPWLTSSNDP